MARRSKPPARGCRRRTWQGRRAPCSASASAQPPSSTPTTREHLQRRGHDSPHLRDAGLGGAGSRFGRALRSCGAGIRFVRVWALPPCSCPPNLSSPAIRPHSSLERPPESRAHRVPELFGPRLARIPPPPRLRLGVARRALWESAAQVGGVR